MGWVCSLGRRLVTVTRAVLSMCPGRLVQVDFQHKQQSLYLYSQEAQALQVTIVTCCNFESVEATLYSLLVLDTCR